MSVQCFWVVPSPQVCKLLHQFEICISCYLWCSLFLSRSGIFGARILFMVFLFYFKDNEDKLLKQITCLRKVSTVLLLFSSQGAIESKTSLFNLFIIIHKEGLRGSLKKKKCYQCFTSINVLLVLMFY